MSAADRPGRPLNHRAPSPAALRDERARLIAAYRRASLARSGSAKAFMRLAAVTRALLAAELKAAAAARRARRSRKRPAPTLFEPAGALL